MRDADLRRAYLAGADLEGAHLEGAQLAQASLDGARLHGASLMGATGLDSVLAEWVDVGPRTAPQRLEGEALQAWFSSAAAADGGKQ